MPRGTLPPISQEVGFFMVNLIEMRRASAGYPGGDAVFHGVDLQLGGGDFVGLIGPNGSGKSTLIRCLAGALLLREGELCYRGKPATEWARRDIAQFLGVVPQEAHVIFSFTVRELVAMGRHPHLRPLRGLTADDWRVVDSALKLADVESFANRSVLELSGGERQRVVIARALAQTPRVLLLDEPSNHLDINHQVEVFDLLYRLNRDEGLTLLCSMHDLNLAAEYCRRIVVMCDGAICAVGTPEEVINAELLSRIYGMDIRVEYSREGSLLVVPVSAKARALDGAE